MKKVRIGTSVIILLFLCLFFHNLLVLMNYFLALFLHELSHLLVACMRGYEIKQFNIDLFGMSIDIDSEIASKDTFIVNIAGPVMNIILCGICALMYYINPFTYVYLRTFCIANLSLAIFNLIPIYPLDGGKIFRGLMREEQFIKIDFIVRVLLGSLFTLMFICTFNDFNWIYLIFVMFLVQTRYKSFSLRRKTLPKKFVVKQLNEDIDIYGALKEINKNEYSVFYVDGVCIPEDVIFDLTLRYPLNSKLKNIKM